MKFLSAVINYIIARLESLVTNDPTDVEDVLAVFNTVVDQLAQVQELHQSEIQQQAEIIADATAKQNASAGQVLAAATAINNINALLGK